MGDVLTLVEKAEESIKADEADEMTKRIMQQKFDFNDFLKQTQMMSSMGGLGNLTKMLPGLNEKKRKQRKSVRFSAITTGASQGGSPEAARSAHSGLPVMLFLCQTSWRLMSLCFCYRVACFAFMG